MHYKHAPIEQRLRNTYFEADMVMRREGAAEIEKLRQRVGELEQTVREKDARIRVLEGKQNFPFGGFLRRDAS
jgi:hypothetical protein